MAALASTKVNVTVVRALIESEGRVLLVRRAHWDTLPGRWELPGGKVDRGEPLLEALAREVEEETGLMLASARLLYTREMLVAASGRTVREYVYVATAIGAVSLSREHDRHAWVETPRERRLTDSAAAAFSLVSLSFSTVCAARAAHASRAAWPPRPTPRTRADA